MNPDDQNYGAGAEAAHQADSIQKQMAAEAIADAPEQPQVDNSILAGIEADEEMKPLSDIIHAGAPESAEPSTGALVPDMAEPTKTEKEKSPSNRKPIIIAAIVVVLILAGVGAWLLISAMGADNGGAKPDPDRMAFFVEGDNGNSSYAIYNDKGDKLTDFIYEKVSDFNHSGYAVAKKVDDEKLGIITNTGKLSIPYEKYSNIESFGNYFIVTENDQTTIVDGSGKKISDYETSESKYGLYSVYSNKKSIIYDEKGDKVGESESKKPLSDATVSEGMACFFADAKERCFDVETGEKLHEFDTEKEVVFTSGVAGASANHQCAIFKGAEDEEQRYILYYGDFKSIGTNDHTYMTAFGYYDDSCYFTDGSAYVMGKDGKKVNVKDFGANITGIVIIDSEHYAYYITSPSYKIVVHINGEEKEYEGMTEFPTIAVNNEYIAIQYSIAKGFGEYENYFAVFKDKIKPAYELNYERTKYVEAKLLDGIDDNGNIATGRHILNVDKGIIYQHPEFTTYIRSYKGVYLARHNKNDTNEYSTVIDKDGKEIIPYGAYDVIKKAGDKYFVAKKGDNYSLLTLDGKTVLEGYDDIRVFDSHFEAMKDGKPVYFTTEAKQIK